MTEKGYILIIDISGYTAYLSQTELTHAQEILESLMNTLTDHIHPPILISRIEGDGIFAYTLKDSFLQGQTLLESLEHLYCTFAFELEHMKRNTTCTCEACRLMPNLDLKMIAHYGEFGLQKIGGRVDLVGTDVILTHRLAKNTIIEKNNIKAYIYLTQACIDALRLNEYAEKYMIPHTETYEHLGEVQGFVHDLHPIWLREQERRRVIVSPEEALVDVIFDLPISAPMAWDYLNDPVERARFLSVDRIDTTKTDGRMMVGSQFHCAHGDVMFDQLIVDWQPFDYYTYDQSLPLVGNLLAQMRITVMLTEKELGTSLRMLVSKPFASNLIARTIARIARKRIAATLIEGKADIEKVLLEAFEINAEPEIPRSKIAAQSN